MLPGFGTGAGQFYAGEPERTRLGTMFDSGIPLARIIIREGSVLREVERHRNNYCYFYNEEMARLQGHVANERREWICKIVDARRVRSSDCNGDIGDAIVADSIEDMIQTSTPREIMLRIVKAEGMEDIERTCLPEQTILQVLWVLRGSTLDKLNADRASWGNERPSNLVYTRRDLVQTLRVDYVRGDCVYGHADVVKIDPTGLIERTLGDTTVRLERMSQEGPMWVRTDMLLRQNFVSDPARWEFVEEPRRVCHEAFCLRSGHYFACGQAVRYCETCGLWQHIECLEADLTAHRGDGGALALQGGFYDENIDFAIDDRLPDAFHGPTTPVDTPLARGWLALVRSPIQRGVPYIASAGPVGFERIFMCARDHQRSMGREWVPREEVEGPQWICQKLREWTGDMEHVPQLREGVVQQWAAFVTGGGGDTYGWFVCQGCQQLV